MQALMPTWLTEIAQSYLKYSKMVHQKTTTKENLLSQVPASNESTTYSHYTLLQAEADILSLRACLALNLAAPVKPTLTVFLLFHCIIRKPLPTAQTVTAARPHLCPVTHTTLCALCATPVIGLAEVRWLCWIDQDIGIEGGTILIYGHQRFPIIATHHADCLVEALHELITNLTEERHLLPAAAESAGPRKTMAFTLRPHLYLDGLIKRKTITIDFFFFWPAILHFIS